jgi:hypothetical protein
LTRLGTNQKTEKKKIGYSQQRPTIGIKTSIGNRISKVRHASIADPEGTGIQNFKLQSESRTNSSLV